MPLSTDAPAIPSSAALDQAVEQWVHWHNSNRQGHCQYCVDLGFKMYRSKRYRALEASWVEILSQILNSHSDPEELEQFVRMLFKTGIEIGLRAAQAGAQ